MKSTNLLSKALNIIEKEGLSSFFSKGFRFVANKVSPVMIKTAFMPANEKRFTRIALVKNFGWGSKESVSGAGSTVDYTRPLRTQLPVLFDKFGIRTVFDDPCGDFNWMKLVLEGTNVSYIGADIVKALIAENTKCSSSPSTRFVHSDITEDRFPIADLWICRDCLFHLSIEDTFKALMQFTNSDILICSPPRISRSQKLKTMTL